MSHHLDDESGESEADESEYDDESDTDENEKRAVNASKIEPLRSRRSLLDDQGASDRDDGSVTDRIEKRVVNVPKSQPKSSLRSLLAQAQHVSGKVLDQDEESDFHEPGVPAVPLPSSRPPRKKMIIVSAGLFHSLAVTEYGECVAWGRNLNGQLGDGTNQRRTSPIVVPLENCVSAAAGYYHSLVAQEDGRCWSWGWNARGQLGDGTKTAKRFPVLVPLENVVLVGAGYHHSLAVRDDGSLWAWGWNPYGQIGDGTRIQRDFPVHVEMEGDVVMVAGGLSHSLAVLADGTCWAWGANAAGQLGDGSEKDRTYPVQVLLDRKVLTIAAANYHSVALLEDGSCWAWGGFRGGQLGDGEIIEHMSPVLVTNQTLCGLHIDEEDVKAALAEAESAIDLLKVERDEKEKRILELLRAQQDFKTRIVNTEQEVADLQKALKASEEANRQLLAKASNAQDESDSLDRERAMLRDENAALQQAIKGLNHRLDHLEAEKEIWRKGQRDLDANKEKWKVKIQRLESEKMILEKNLERAMAGRPLLRPGARVVIRTDYIPNRHLGKYTDGDFAIVQEVGFPECSVRICRNERLVRDIKTDWLDLAPLTKTERTKNAVESKRSLGYEQQSVCYFGEEADEDEFELSTAYGDPQGAASPASAILGSSPASPISPGGATSPASAIPGSSPGYHTLADAPPLPTPSPSPSAVKVDIDINIANVNGFGTPFCLHCGRSFQD